MDQKNSNLYSTEIPVTQAEQELRGPSLSLPNTTPTPTLPPNSSPVPPSQTTPPPSPLPKRPSNLPKIIIGFLVMIIILLSIYIVTTRMSTTSHTPSSALISPTTTPRPSLQATATPTPTLPPTQSTNQSSNRFFSQQLGIYFDYAKIIPNTGNKAAIVEAQGSRVYVGMDDADVTTGQYVDVLTKLNTDTTLQAVTKITINDPNYAGCTFSLQTQAIYPSTYEKIVPTCPAHQTDGVTFFLGDTSHPDKLLFFNIGQYGIQASNDLQILWHDTLRFL